MFPPRGILLSAAHARQRQAASVVHLLAWSVKYQVPLPDALAALRPRRGGRLLRAVLSNPFILGPLALLLRWRWRFARRTQRAARALDEGQPLAPVLARYFADWLPPSYLAAVADAERRGALAAELAQLTPLLHDANRNRVPLRMGVYVALVRLGLLLLVCGALWIWVLPRLAAMGEDFGTDTVSLGAPAAAALHNRAEVQHRVEAWYRWQGYGGYWWGTRPFAHPPGAVPPPEPTHYGEDCAMAIGYLLIWVPDYLCHNTPDMLYWLVGSYPLLDFVEYMMGVATYLAWWMLLAVAVMALSAACRRVLRRTNRYTLSLQDWLLLPVPLFGPLVRQQRALEGLAMMRAALASGLDWPAALERQAALCPYGWYRRRCASVAAAVRAGERWDLAWQRGRLTPPALDWVLAAGAQREEPAATLATLEALLRAQLDVALARGERWLEIGTTCVGALIAGGTGYLIFGFLRVVVETIIAWEG